MFLQVLIAVVDAGATSFTFVVPGHQVWRPRAFHALANRAVGGTPDRSYTLTITNGSVALAAVAAADAGDEPGTCEVTWASTPAAASSAGPVGVTVAPLGDLVLPAGYEVRGDIVDPAVGDEWISATAWFDYGYST